MTSSIFSRNPYCNGVKPDVEQGAGIADPAGSTRTTPVSSRQ